MTEAERLDSMERAMRRLLATAPVPMPVPVPAASMPDHHDMADRVLLLKLNSLEGQIEVLTDMVRQLMNDRYPRYVGTTEACKILGIGSTTMDKRLKAGYYPFAIKENGRWRFPLAELLRFQNQL